MSRIGNWVESRPVWIIELDDYRIAGNRQDGAFTFKTKKAAATFIADELRLSDGKPVRVWAKYERI